MKNFVFLLLFVASAATTLLAQYSTAKNALSYRLLAPWEGIESGDDLFDLGAYDFGASATYYHAFDNHWGLEVPFQLGIADLKDPDSERRRDNIGFLGLGAMARYQLFKHNKQVVVPYATAGLHFEYSDLQDLRVGVPIGGGADLRLAHHIYLTGGVDYRFGLNDDNWRWTVLGGLKFILGGGQPAEPEPEKPADRDGDGISDNLDQCPDEIGTADMMGCPDRDGDKIADKDDACPDIAGLAAFNGCPDTDGDGITDGEDKCPDEKGPATNNGCPIKVVDTDNDGVEDALDACPTERGPAATKGCPDTDNDGVADKDDDCPRERGLPQFNGCPDTDGDGIPDAKDKCPTAAGPASNNGCPDLKVEEKQVLQVAMKAVQFETGSAVLKTSSYSVLDQIASIMNTYQTKKLSINGHTDSVGSESNNQRLSENRAKSCYDYLIRKGVSPSRIRYIGYGESNPVASNTTKEGRAENRRVEFIITD